MALNKAIENLREWVEVRPGVARRPLRAARGDTPRAGPILDAIDARIVALEQAETTTTTTTDYAEALASCAPT